MENIITIAILVALAVQILPVSLGFSQKNNPWQTFMFALVLVAGQIVLLNVGYLLGTRFLHLLDEYKGIVILSGFFIIGIRMILETFKIRKGERTFEIVNFTTAILIAIVIGINTFLAGLLLTYVSTEIGYSSAILFVSSLLFCVLGAQLKKGKLPLALSSFLMFLSGLIMLFAAIYFGVIT